MTVQLPGPIARYFAADRRKDPDAIAECFTEIAWVKDEGRTHAGRDAIRRWKAGSSSKYTFTSEPFACTTEGGRTTVTSRLAGDFPGSPVELRYVFGLQDERISELEITP